MCAPFLRRLGDQQHAAADQQETEDLDRAEPLAEEHHPEQDHEWTVGIADDAHAPGAEFIERAQVQGVGQRNADQAAEHGKADFDAGQAEAGAMHQERRR